MQELPTSSTQVSASVGQVTTFATLKDYDRDRNRPATHDSSAKTAKIGP